MKGAQQKKPQNKKTTKRAPKKPTPILPRNE
uniref:Uncharacterized protein n=1 Tax=Marseillevirus LCMAC103 TaxID=2506604 RepID=A0A481YWV6_9VIRU|nr:MAG: hypothetical protein LCMAC103_03500 [Marseillevirus LCMAC103]